MEDRGFLSTSGVVFGFAQWIMNDLLINTLDWTFILFGFFYFGKQFLFCYEEERTMKRGVRRGKLIPVVAIVSHSVRRRTV